MKFNVNETQDKYRKELNAEIDGLLADACEAGGTVMLGALQPPQGILTLAAKAAANVIFAYYVGIENGEDPAP